MIHFVRGTANTFDVTLTEKTTISSPTFLFRFTNEATGTQNTCIASDTSSYTRRYNRFTITESSSENRANGTLSLPYTGFWKYEVYEQSDSTLVVTTQNKVEEGIMSLSDTAVNTYVEQPSADTYVE